MKRWFAMATQFTRDPKIQALGEEIGPAGPLVISVLLGQAKIAGEGGRVEATYRDLGHDAFTDASTAQKTVELAYRLGVLEVPEEGLGERSFVAAFPNWRRYQEAFRKQQDREDEGASDPPSSAEKAQLSASRPSVSNSDKDKTTTETPTTTEPEQTFEVPSSLLPLTANVNRVVEGKRAKPLKLRAVVKACLDFPDRDLFDEADKFAHYWLDGAGENRDLSDVGGAWRNWLRRAPSALNGRPQHRIDRRVHELGQLAERLQAQEAT